MFHTNFSFFSWANTTHIFIGPKMFLLLCVPNISVSLIFTGITHNSIIATMYLSRNKSQYQPTFVALILSLDIASFPRVQIL